VDYLLGLNDALRQEHNDVQAEVARLADTVGHIRDVIDSQQRFAGQSEFRQEVKLSVLVEDALLLNRELLDLHRIEVNVDLPPLPELLLNKSKMTQVLVNLVRNAVQAMQNWDSDVRLLTISARAIEDNGIEIEVEDTGWGFDERVRMKLFTHGFTTTPNGNGFGLHYCANAIQGAGGTVTAESPGAGQGATFRVRLFQAMPCDAIAT
jgi:signal transduction histidine kinase